MSLLMPTSGELAAALDGSVAVIREIRRAGQRTVYEVNVAGDRRVLKLMFEKHRNRAEREVLLARDFDHPNLARILDRELHDVRVGGFDYVYFTETFVDGYSLDERPDRMDACEALRLAADLVSAVEYLWERKVVHRDIKPANVMVHPSSGFVLLDVGIGRHQGKDTLTSAAMPHGPGTTGYLAPEQLQPLKGRELDYRADYFAIGIVVFEQITGELPFDPEHDSYRTLLTTGLASGIDRVPEVLQPLLRRLLAPHPHGRYRLGKASPAISDLKESLGCS